MGFDAHRFNETPPVTLAGVVVDQTRGIEATSDGDVVTHAVIDAICGAAVLGDIGEHFPPGDPQWRDADSVEMLTETTRLAANRGWEPSHVDVTVIADALGIAPHREVMRQTLASTLALDLEAVSIKATTTDGLLTATTEGVMVTAVATLTSRENHPSVP